MTQICLESHIRSEIFPSRQYKALRKGLIPAPVGGGLIPAYHCIFYIELVPHKTDVSMPYDIWFAQILVMNSVNKDSVTLKI